MLLKISPYREILIRRFVRAVAFSQGWGKCTPITSPSPRSRKGDGWGRRSSRCSRESFERIRLRSTSVASVQVLWPSTIRRWTWTTGCGTTICWPTSFTGKAFFPFFTILSFFYLSRKVPSSSSSSLSPLHYYYTLFTHSSIIIHKSAKIESLDPDDEEDGCSVFQFIPVFNFIRYMIKTCKLSTYLSFRISLRK